MLVAAEIQALKRRRSGYEKDRGKRIGYVDESEGTADGKDEFKASRQRQNTIREELEFSSPATGCVDQG